MEITELIKAWENWQASESEKGIVRNTISAAENEWNQKNDNTPNIVEKHLSADDLLAVAPRQNVNDEVVPHPAVVRFCQEVF